MQRGWLKPWLFSPGATAAIIYVGTTALLSLVAPRHIWYEHTPYNHFAWLASSFLEGRADFPLSPPSYAGGNDFAYFGGRWFVVFPGFPALLLLPWVKLAGGPDNVFDGAFFLLLSGLAPVGLYFTLHRLREAGIAPLSRQLIALVPLLYAFGTVYFFTAVQGTVWFAAHVTASVLTCFLLWASVEARRPLTAGLLLSALLSTRTHLAVYGVFFLLELWRVRSVRHESGRSIDAAAYRALVAFGFPVVTTAGMLALYNYQRFGSVTEFGYRYLAIAWHARIDTWGLFGYHYLARNLGAVLTSLPYVAHGESGSYLQVNGHGLALWVTSPFYLWLLWPKRSTVIHRAIYVTLALAAAPSLLYQNSGWQQFGQRFSNDYAPLLMLLLALGGYAWGRTLKGACVWAVAVNLFGAMTFGRAEYARYYFIERSQRILYQPD